MQLRPFNSKYVLLADDDEDDCMFFQDALSEIDSSATLKTANDGHALMELLDTTVPPNRPDVIFLDLNMPRKNGLECLKEIRETEKLKNIPVVIFSTTDKNESVRATYDLGANFFVQKPDSFNRLINSIKHVLAMDLKESHSQPLYSQFFHSF